MLGALREKVRSLIFGEDGVALVVTLASFFFMYLMAMGVYAVGTSVKERIHLQNACDAAAYSAAVVQADTLSRIATINRAMSWTYVQMTRRQLDHIVKCWLELVSSRYHADLARASSSGSPGRHMHHYWQSEENERNLTLNRHWPVMLKDVDGHLREFRNDYQSGPSYYAAPGSISAQITRDKETIDRMNFALEDLAGRLSSRIRETAESVFAANDVKGRKPRVFPLDSGNFFRTLQSWEEDLFLRFSEYQDGSFATFEAGSEPGGWFSLQGGEGFYRKYQQKSNRLLAEWDWWYIRWRCPPRGACIPFTSTFRDSVLGENARDENFDGFRACPIVLEPSYFGRDGTITVGFACENANPWLSVLKTITGGIFSAFDPYCMKTVVFASAKAGYRTYDEGMSRGRNYQVDWKNEEEWNLYTSDWDAVLMPVRMAKTMATDRHWDPAEGNFLGEWVEQLGVRDDEMRAGGEDALADAKLPTGDEESLSAWWRKQPPPNRTFAVQTKWQVGKCHQRPAWNQLTNRMFH